MSLTDFIAQRIDEERSVAIAALALESESTPSSSGWGPQRIVAECEANRAILALHEESREHFCDVATGSEVFGASVAAPSDADDAWCPTPAQSRSALG